MNPPSAEELKNHPVFGALDQFSLERLMQVARLEQLRRHEALYSSGERPEKVALILEGTVKVTSVAANKREVILDLLGAGDIVGDESVSDDRRNYAATIMRDATLLSFPTAAVRTLWSRNPDFAMAWLKAVAQGKQRLQDRISELAYGNIEDRLLRMLTHLVAAHGAKTKKGNVALRFRLTHQELANLIGATRETTTLAVGRLKTTGAITFIDGKIVVKDRARPDGAAEERVG